MTFCTVNHSIHCLSTFTWFLDFIRCFVTVLFFFCWSLSFLHRLLFQNIFNHFWFIMLFAAISRCTSSFINVELLFVLLASNSFQTFKIEAGSVERYPYQTHFHLLFLLRGWRGPLISGPYIKKHYSPNQTWNGGI